MKTQKNILIAFILNLGFSIFEFFGGIISNSTAIMSDAFHDIVDAVSIGISLILEKKSFSQPDDKYTYGYRRLSVLGALFTTIMLMTGSLLIVVHSMYKLRFPSNIRYDEMIFFAVMGIAINIMAAFVTRGSGSANQRAVNLHMTEDVLGWVVVLMGAVVMRFTNLYFIDPLMSICVAIFIISHSFGNIRQIYYLFLEKVPDGISISDIKQGILEINGVTDVHHIHVWSLDGQQNLATMHIIASHNHQHIKEKVRKKLEKYGIFHSTLEFCDKQDDCQNTCSISRHTHDDHLCNHHH